MEIKGNSYYINPNNRTLTTDIKNTVVSEQSMYESIQKTLRPVDDMQEVLMNPIKLSGRTNVNSRCNSINLAEGANVTVKGGFVLTVGSKGVEVSGGDINNQKARQEAIDMAGALSTLLRNASGTMNNVAFSSAAKTTWTENVSKVLNYFGIDTTQNFSVNGMRYTKNENGHWVSEANIDAIEAYEKYKTTNQTYEFADEKTKKLIEHMSNYYLKNVPESVSEAWQETLVETGINPFPDGYTSVLQQLSMEQDFLTGGNDNIFGDTIESSVDAIERILERIDNPIAKNGSNDATYINTEKEFYLTLLSKIKLD